MEFSVLGPLAVGPDGAAQDVRGRQLRITLALLLLNANRVVSTDALIAGGWDEDRSERPTNAVEAQVVRLRRKLGEWDRDGLGRNRLVTRSGGYQLTVGADELDLTGFQRLSASGRAQLADDPDAAVADLRAALAFWRGPALLGLEGPPFAETASRLEHSRLTTRTDLFQAELRCGRHREVLDELFALVEAYPLQESFYDLLMVSLCRSGFVGDALSTYRRARRVLIAELGIEPSPALRSRMERILRNDASGTRVPLSPAA